MADREHRELHKGETERWRNSGYINIKNKIVKIWRTITLKTCSNLINSIPRRLQCLINKKGFQITKKDNNDIKKRKILLNVIVWIVKINYSRCYFRIKFTTSIFWKINFFSSSYFLYISLIIRTISLKI